jgi:GT2 family glycosyltransferase
VLIATVRWIVKQTAYGHYEILVVHAGDLTDRDAAVLIRLGARAIRCEELAAPENAAGLINLGSHHARGDHLVVLQAGVVPQRREWLTAMLEYSQQEAVGAVGAKLVTRDGRLEHVGIALGVGGVAAHLLQGHPRATRGYMSAAINVRNYSAVSGGCLMMRRELFERLGGFDERVGRDLYDVDYCLRARRAGYRIVYTPYAELTCPTLSPSRGRHAEELSELRERWGSVLDAADPYYNPNFDRAWSDYRLPTAPVSRNAAL